MAEYKNVSEHLLQYCIIKVCLQNEQLLHQVHVKNRNEPKKKKVSIVRATILRCVGI